MKSNIGLVFVVNSGKAFGRFVKEFAGEEEMTVVLLNRRTHSSLSRFPANLTVVFVAIVERECEVLKPVGEANPNFLFGRDPYIKPNICFFFFPPPKKKCFFIFFRAATSNSQSVSHFCLHCEAGFHWPAQWWGPAGGSIIFYLSIFCALLIVTDFDM